MIQHKTEDQLEKQLLRPGSGGSSALPRLWRVAGSGFSGHDGWVDLEFYRRQVAQGRVPTTSVVEDLEVVGDRVPQRDSRGPALPIQEFDLHARPERLHVADVVQVPDRAHRRNEAGLPDSLGECPEPELNALFSVDTHADQFGTGIDDHAQGIGDQRPCGTGVDRTADDAPLVGVHDDGAVHLALAGGVLRDVGDPQGVHTPVVEPPVDQVAGHDLGRLAALRAATYDALQSGPGHQ